MDESQLHNTRDAVIRLNDNLFLLVPDKSDCVQAKRYDSFIGEWVTSTAVVFDPEAQHLLDDALTNPPHNTQRDATSLRTHTPPQQDLPPIRFCHDPIIYDLASHLYVVDTFPHSPSHPIHVRVKLSGGGASSSRFELPSSVMVDPVTGDIYAEDVIQGKDGNSTSQGSPSGAVPAPIDANESTANQSQTVQQNDTKAKMATNQETIIAIPMFSNPFYSTPSAKEKYRIQPPTQPPANMLEFANTIRWSSGSEKKRYLNRAYQIIQIVDYENKAHLRMSELRFLGRCAQGHVKRALLGLLMNIDLDGLLAQKEGGIPEAEKTVKEEKSEKQPRGDEDQPPQSSEEAKGKGSSADDPLTSLLQEELFLDYMQCLVDCWFFSQEHNSRMPDLVTKLLTQLDSIQIHLFSYHQKRIFCVYLFRLVNLCTMDGINLTAYSQKIEQILNEIPETLIFYTEQIKMIISMEKKDPVDYKLMWHELYIEVMRLFQNSLSSDAVSRLISLIYWKPPNSETEYDEYNILSAIDLLTWVTLLSDSATTSRCFTFLTEIVSNCPRGFSYTEEIIYHSLFYLADASQSDIFKLEIAQFITELASKMRCSLSKKKTQNQSTSTEKPPKQEKMKSSNNPLSFLNKRLYSVPFFLSMADRLPTTLFETAIDYRAIWNKDDLERINPSFFSTQANIYIPAKGKRSSEGTEDFADSILRKFLSSKDRILIVSGSAGVGKSAFLRSFKEQAKQLVTDLRLEYEIKFVYLPMITDAEITEYDIRDIDELDAQDKETTDTVPYVDQSISNENKNGEKGKILLMDGIDEMKIDDIKKLLPNNWGTIHDYRIIMTYRQETPLGPSDYQKIFNLGNLGNLGNPENQVTIQFSTLHILPFDVSDIKQYVSLYGKLTGLAEATVVNLEKILLRTHAISELSCIPFMLNLILTISSEFARMKTINQHSITRYQIFDKFTKSWFSGINDESASKHCVYESIAIAAAEEMIKTKSTSISRLQFQQIIQDKRILRTTSVIAKISMMRIVRDDSGEKYQFFHRYIRDFFVAKKVVDVLGSNKELWKNQGSVISSLQTNDSIILGLVAESISQNQEILKKLLDIVKSSASMESNEHVHHASSIAITLLSYAKCPIHKEDFTGIKIPKADLSLAVLQYVDFTGADLTGVKFRNANIRGCTFKKANMTDVDFGVLPKLHHEKPVSNVCSFTIPGKEGKTVFTSSDDTIFTCDIPGNMKSEQIGKSDGKISSMAQATSGNKQYLFCGDNLGNLYVWNISTNERVLKLAAEESIIGKAQITSICVLDKSQNQHPDKEYLLVAVGAINNKFAIVEFQLGSETQDIKTSRVIFNKDMSRSVKSIASFSKGVQSYIAVAGEMEYISVFEINYDEVLTCKEVLKLDTEGKAVGSLTVLHVDNTFRIAASVHKVIFIFDVQTEENTGTLSLDEKGKIVLNKHDKTIIDIRWVHIPDSNQQYLVSAGQDKIIYLWSVSKEDVIDQFLGPSSKVVQKLEVIYHGERWYLLGACEDGNVWIWDRFINQPAKELLRHKKAVNALSLLSFKGDTSSQSKLSSTAGDILFRAGLVVTGSSDKSIKMWDFSTGRCLLSREAGDMVPRIFVRGKNESIEIFYSQGDHYEWFDPFELNGASVSRTKKLIEKELTEKKLWNLDVKTSGNSDFIFYIANESFRYHIISTDIYEELHKDSFGFYMSDFNDKKSSLILVTTSGVICGLLIEENGQMKFQSSYTIPIGPNSEPEYNAKNTVISKLIILKSSTRDETHFAFTDESGILVYGCFYLDGKQESFIRLHFVKEEPLYSLDSFITGEIEYVVFGGRDGYIRIKEIVRGAEKEKNDELLFEKKLHNQVRSIQYDVTTESLLTCGEDGNICLWKIDVVKDEQEEKIIQLLLVWTTHESLDGQGINYGELQGCSGMNEILLEQLASSEKKA